MADQPDWISDLVTGAGPALAAHDIDRAPLDIPRSDGGRLDAGAGLHQHIEVHVRILPLPLSDEALVLDVLLHVEHRKGVVGRNGYRSQRNAHNHEAEASDIHKGLQNSLDDLLWRNDRLFLDWIPGITPLFKRVTDLCAPRFAHGCGLEIIAGDRRFLGAFRVVPGVGHRQAIAIRRHLEPFEQAGLWRPNS